MINYAAYLPYITISNGLIQCIYTTYIVDLNHQKKQYKH